MLTPPSPSGQILPRPLSGGQCGWLRWPLAGSLAVALTAGMLVALAAATHPWQRPPVPERLAADLRAPATPHAQATPAVPTAPTLVRPARPRPLAPTASTEPHASLMPAPVPSPNRESPASPPSSAAQSGPPGISTPANPGHPLAPNAGAALATAGTSPAGVAALPLKQRCKVQVFPDFPKRAQEDDVEQGHVLVRLHLDARGQVSEVSILEARPAGYFEAAARKAALQWRCLPSEQANDTVRVPFEFSLK